MTQSAPLSPPPESSRRAVFPKTIALLGLAGMLVLWILEFQALSWESGDRVLYLNYLGIAVCVVTTSAAVFWAAWARRKVGAITVLIMSVLINPIWLLLLIRALG